MASAPTLGPLSTAPGRGGLPRVVATHAASGAALEVYLHGAHVTSYSHAGAELPCWFLLLEAVMHCVVGTRSDIPPRTSERVPTCTPSTLASTSLLSRLPRLREASRSRKP
jgi:hypothetical protein